MIGHLPENSSTTASWLEASAGGSASQASASPRSVTMRHAGELERFVEHAEHAVAPEIDARYVGTQKIVAGRRAEAKAPVLGAERQEMAPQRPAVDCGKLGNRQS